MQHRVAHATRLCGVARESPRRKRGLGQCLQIILGDWRRGKVPKCGSAIVVANQINEYIGIQRLARHIR